MKIAPQNRLLILVVTAVVSGACASSSNQSAMTSALFSEPWISGMDKNEPPLQAQRYDADTFVIRQSLTTSFEAPFMYLIFGEATALLIDTGAGGIDLRTFVDAQIDAWLRSNGREKISLVVMHSHAHGDHTAGDEQFANRADTTVVGHEAQEVADFFGIERWPEATKDFDLGNRVVDIIPTPGHQDSHVMVYDRSTQLLFSGDVLYPGRLYFQCAKADEFKRSIDRVAEFANSSDVRWILGAHIELAQRPGKSFSAKDSARKDERPLEMAPSSIDKVRSALLEMGEQIRVEPHDDFILFPHPADPTGKKPPDWCLR